MKTDTLVEALARDIEPVGRPRTQTKFALATLFGAVLAACVVSILFGLRDNLGGAIGAVTAKSLYCLTIAAAAAPLAYLLSQPNISARRWVLPVALVVLASFSIAGLSLATIPAEARMSAWLAGGFPECLRRIPILATPVAVALLFVARSMAPTRLTLAGASIGGLSGAIAAVAYSWFCPVDSVAYVATWYLAAILLCAALGAVFGRWLLRW